MAGNIYSFSELRSLWLNAGGSPQWADTMAAVALAESSGCRYALHGPKDVRPVKVCSYNYSTGENSAGLWQINLMAHPQYNIYAMFYPAENAAAAVAIKGGGPPTDWSTYTNGAYQTYLPSGLTGQTAATLAPKHDTPRIHFKPDPQGGLTGHPVTLSVTDAWHELTYAIGRTLPTQSHETRNILVQIRHVAKTRVR